MRICLISQEYPPETAWGGVGTQTWVKARALARLGHDVHVLACSAWEQQEIRTEVHDGVTVHRIQPPGHDFPVYGKPLWMLGWTWLVVQTLDELMDHHRFDVLDFPEFGGEGFGYQIDRTRWNWAAVVVQVHGPSRAVGSANSAPSWKAFRCGTPTRSWPAAAAWPMSWPAPTASPGRRSTSCTVVWTWRCFAPRRHPACSPIGRPCCSSARW
jgi:hypothetical protein